MRKSSKIWKIEKFGHEFYSGQCITITRTKSPIDVQLIYESELDCLLDIVTEPENRGLKVYKHQSKEICDVDLKTKKQFVLLRQKDNDYYCSYSRYYELEKANDLISAGTHELAFKFLEDSEYDSYERTVYHWVEAFLQ
jgi:hypothetical protein